MTKYLSYLLEFHLLLQNRQSYSYQTYSCFFFYIGNLVTVSKDQLAAELWSY